MDERAHVIYVLVLVQAGCDLVAVFGLLLFMANPLYAVLPVAKAAVLLFLAAMASGGRIWALVALLTLQAASLFGVTASLLVGLLPWLDRTVTLAGLLTEIGLPVTVIVLCAQQLAAVTALRAPGVTALRAPGVTAAGRAGAGSGVGA